MGNWFRTPAQRLEVIERRLAALERHVAEPEQRAYRRVQANGEELPQRDVLNFVTGVLSDNTENGSTDVA